MPRYSEAQLAAIKNAVDIVEYARESLPSPVERSGSNFKTLCPFHDDHRPSLILNPERRSFKCWSCGAGGDIFTFVKDLDRIDFPEAVRMLAERTGIVLDSPSGGSVATAGPSKSDLLAVNAWAEGLFVSALAQAPEVREYVASRSISRASVDRFRLGYAPDTRDWLLSRARREGYSVAMLEQAGLITESSHNPGLFRDRFRGRLVFPIHDLRGRAVGFGGRILPATERALAAEGRDVAKYLNSSETVLFQKRRLLYAADLARDAARQAKSIFVVEGYTDVIAAHQVGLTNVVAALGTAVGDEHVVALRSLADRVVLVFDGDEAGQKAADRSLELFLKHEVDVRVLILPEKLDPCDFLLREGAEPFRAMVERAIDPLAFAVQRASSRFDINSPEGSRKAAEEVLSILARVPNNSRMGLDVKVGKALDSLARRLGVSVDTLDRRLRELRRTTKRAAGSERTAAIETGAPETPPIHQGDLDPIDRELIQIVLNEPSVVGRLITRVAVDALRDAPLRAILQACYDLHGEGETPAFERVSLRLDGPVRALAAGLLLLPVDPAPLPDDPKFGPAKSVRPGSWEDRFSGVLAQFAERERQARLRELRASLEETDESANPVEFRALQLEYRRLLNQRPNTKTR